MVNGPVTVNKGDLICIDMEKGVLWIDTESKPKENSPPTQIEQKIGQKYCETHSINNCRCMYPENSALGLAIIIGWISGLKPMKINDWCKVPKDTYIFKMMPS